MNKRFSGHLRAGLIAAALACNAAVVHAATTTYTDKTDFLNNTGATSATGLLPLDEGPLASKTVNSITFGAFAGSALHFGTTNPAYPLGWSSLISGHDMAVSGFESFDIVASGPVFAMGFEAHEPGVGGSGSNTCGVAICADSTFTITVLNGAAAVALPFVVDFTNDTAAFFGVSSTLPFDRFQVRETIGGIDDEYFGQVFTSVTAVPEPSTWALLGAGFAMLGLQRRRLLRLRN